MALKSRIISELGDTELLLPDRIARSLIANDQVKYYFALLQMARANAERPTVPAPISRPSDLRARSGDAWLDDVVASARNEGAQSLTLPHSPKSFPASRGRSRR